MIKLFKKQIPKQASNKLEQRNFNIGPVEFNQLVVGLKKGNNELFEKIYLVQFKETLIFLKKNYNATHEAAYDTTMDVLLKFRNLLIQDKVTYNNMRFLFTKMATQHYMKSQKKEKELIKISVEQPSFMKSANIGFSEETLKFLDQAWMQLCENCQQLLKSFYYDGITLKKLSSQLAHSSESATRQKRKRCVDKLKKTFLKLYQSP